jgi:DNA repair ATPase RecN
MRSKKRERLRRKPSKRTLKLDIIRKSGLAKLESIIIHQMTPLKMPIKRLLVKFYVIK